MDFTFNEEQQQIKKMVDNIARNKIALLARELEEKEKFPHESIQLLAEQGLMGLLIPPSFGGAGADIYSFLIALEAIGRACTATGFIYNAQMASSQAILAMGSEEQKNNYLKQMASGKLLCTLAITESGGGTTPASIKTFARQEGEKYILNGNKIYISSAGEADLYLVIAKTDNHPGPSSLSAFLVATGTPGLSFGKKEDKMGLRALPTREVIFEECIVSKDALLGPLGGALGVIGIVVGLTALGAAAIALGLAQAAVDQTKKYLLERVIIDKKLGEINPVQLRFAEMVTELNAIRALLFRAAYDRATSSPGPIPTVFQAKVFAAEKALEIIDSAIQLHGANGYSREFPLEKYYRDARALTIQFGNSDVFRIMISQAVLS